MSSPLDIQGVVRASELESNTAFRPDDRAPDWDFELLKGRLGELSSSARHANLTLAGQLLCNAQQKGKLTAWVSGRKSLFFPPDFEQLGVDLQALPVIDANESSLAVRVADDLIGSGGFQLVIADLGRVSSIAGGLQKRLRKHVQQHQSGVLFLTERPANWNRVGTLVSFRAIASRDKQTTGSDTQFECTLEALVDKQNGPNWTMREVYRGPPGLR